MSRFPLLAGLLSAVLAVPLSAPVVRAQCATCGTPSCCNGPSCGACPKPYLYYFEGRPRIKFKHACPRPICDPCNLEHYGYYQTCWCPWPFPPDMRHCPCANTHPAVPYLLGNPNEEQHDGDKPGKPTPRPNPAPTEEEAVQTKWQIPEVWPHPDR
jgi:hypothetical protein